MCGIAGFIEAGDGGRETLAEQAGRMAARLRHRGPDDSGVWVDGGAGVGLAHQRLSIIDLSPSGAQPMLSASGRYVLVFNGEIYNHKALRRELVAGGAAPGWRGHSDTEVMLAALEHWGVAQALARFNGMFAFALWDRREQVLHLGRDRLGEKPLYYGWAGGTFLFASELKALSAHRHWRGEIDRDALALMMRHNAIPAPYCIYKGIFKLPPGSYAIVRPGAVPGEAQVTQYWSLQEVVRLGRSGPLHAAEADAVEELDALLRDAVALRMEADVPLGAFLSGGIDSSTVVALMQARSRRRIETFSIGFHERDMNEADHAKAVAAHLGTEHTELYVTPQEAMAVIPQLAGIYDEPFADSSQIPTLLVAALARRKVTVSLSGDGGDEVFGGYNRYIFCSSVWHRLKRVPHPLRVLGAHCIRMIPPQQYDRAGRSLRWALPPRLRLPMLGDKMHKGADLLSARNSQEVYRELVSHWKSPANLVRDAVEPPTVLTDASWHGHDLDFVAQMMAIDTVSYLPDDILTKVDRATMAVSLEGRIPLLDHRVVEFAWRLPQRMKVRDGAGKWILRQVLDRYVPRRLTERPKMGFGVPLHHWLRGPLRPWAEALLDESRIRREGYLDPAPVRRVWREHLEGRRDWQYYLWDVLMFQAWLEHEAA